MEQNSKTEFELGLVVLVHEKQAVIIVCQRSLHVLNKLVTGKIAALYV